MTVLLVEDDALIRMDAADMLREMGYEVLEAEYGPDAVVQLRERPIDVLVTDVGLPGMSGTELAERARQLQPDIGLVFATGDTELESREGRPRAAILCKPYDSASLAESVRRALARP
ncbi:response regulator [Frateuria sp. GZRR35]|uniref:response regulator n=1 Tax=unclassified Frateuria TaxID=2648894 RepID=UPI003EDBF3D0